MTVGDWRPHNETLRRAQSRRSSNERKYRDRNPFHLAALQRHRSTAAADESNPSLPTNNPFMMVRPLDEIGDVQTVTLWRGYMQEVKESKMFRSHLQRDLAYEHLARKWRYHNARLEKTRALNNILHRAQGITVNIGMNDFDVVQKSQLRSLLVQWHDAHESLANLPFVL